MAMRKQRMADYMLALALLLSAGAQAGIRFVSGHLPVAGDYEKSHTIVFFVLLTGLIYRWFAKPAAPNNKAFMPLALIVLLLSLFSGLRVSDNYLIYSMPSVVLFFQLRMLAIALFIFALSLYVSAFQNRSENLRYQAFMQYAKGITVLGAAAFLGGEFFGSLWSLNGWGDPWRWSSNFFIASGIFLLSMLSVHVPARYRKTQLQEVLIPSAILLVITLLYFI
jgi:hypothetical protein